MNILNSTNYLLKHFTGLFLIHTLFADDVVKEFSPLHVLHDQKQVFGSFDDLIKLNNIGMADEFEDMYFSSNPLHICHIHYSILFQNFDCNFLPGWNVGGQFNFPKSTLSQSFLLIRLMLHMR